MLYKECVGDILDDTSQALVNTVNCIGIMGKGLALQFKKEFPDMFSEYVIACKRNEVRVGKMWVYATQYKDNKYVINFPTKIDWRNPSEINWIKRGIIDLVYTIAELEITSIAIPALGCTNGGLDWKDVSKVVYSMLDPISDRLNIRVYKPQ